MDQIISYLREVIPAPLVAGIIISVLVVVFMTETTKSVLTSLESWLEEKKGKEIKFFDHKKILLSIFWSILTTVFLVVAGKIKLSEYPLYLLVIIGASNVFYELILRTIKEKLEKN